MNLKVNDLFASRYRLIDQVGVGGFSVVWLATDEMAGDLKVAIKIYAPERGLDKEGIQQFKKEFLITAQLKHPGLLKANYFDVVEGSPFLVMSYCSKGSLNSLLFKKGNLNEHEIAEVLIECSSALAYLHKKGILHQDIKPDNILIDDDGDYLLTDFGISSRMRSTLRKSTTSPKALTLAYAPPERFGAIQESLPAGDIFSLGVMIYELATGDVPWMGAGGTVVTETSTLPQLPSEFSKPLSDLMQRCLCFNPSERITAQELNQVCEQFIRTGEWSELKKKEEKQPQSGGRRTEPFSSTKLGKSSNPVEDQKTSRSGGTDDSTQREKRNKTVPVSVWFIGIFIIGLVLVFQFPSLLPKATKSNKTEDLLKDSTLLESELALPDSNESRLLKVETGEKDSFASIEQNQIVEEETISPEAEKEILRKKILDEINMVFVQGGTFQMGCDSTREKCSGNGFDIPQHEVTLSSFYIGESEVTQKLWRLVTGRSFRDQWNINKAGIWEEKKSSIGDQKPIIFLSWKDTQMFIKKLNSITEKNFRLPYEAEWEFAASGGNRSNNYLHSGSNNFDEVGWSTVFNVKRKKPNELGIYDMSGNAEEWCNDWWDRNYYSYSPSVNPRGPNQSKIEAKVIRGVNASQSRSYRGRLWADPWYGDSDQGMRLCHDIPYEKE